jgi:hypothetical protein
LLNLFKHTLYIVLIDDIKLEKEPLRSLPP